jgi:Flp pilus assembly protein TadD
MKPRPAQLIATSFLVLALATAASSQFKERAHQVEGTIRLADSFAPADRARVTLQQRGFVRGELVTDSDGGFFFHSVGPGEYEVVVSLQGYKEARLRVSVKNASVRGLAIELEPNHPGKSTTTTTIAAQELALSDQARRHHEKGLSAIGKADFEAALNHFERVISLHPDFAGAYYGLGLSFYFLQKLEPAEDAFRRAIELDRNFAPAYVLLGRLLNDQQRPREARAVLGEALAGGNDRWDALYELARASLAQGDFPQAEEKLRRAHSFQNSGPQVHLLLSNVLVVRGNYEGALGEMRHYLQVEPNGPFASEVRAKAAALEAELEKRRAAN